MVGLDRTHQGFRVCSTHLVVDVEAVGSTTNRHNLSAQLVEDFGSDVVGRAMRSIDHNLESFECQVVGKSTFAKLDVTARSVI